MQLLLFGYQQRVNNVGFKDSLRFFTLAEIIVNSLRKPCSDLCTLLLSANSGIDFRKLSWKGLSDMPPNRRQIAMKFMRITGLSDMAPIGRLPVEFEDLDPGDEPPSIRLLLEG